MQVTYWQRIMCGIFGALSAVCFTTASRYEGHDWLITVGALLVLPLLPVVPVWHYLSNAAAEMVHTYMAGVQVRNQMPSAPPPSFAKSADGEGDGPTFGVA